MKSLKLNMEKIIKFCFYIVKKQDASIYLVSCFTLYNYILIVVPYLCNPTSLEINAFT